MGLSLPVALCAVVLEGRGRHAGLHRRNDFAWPYPGFADRPGPPGPGEPAGSHRAPGQVLADLTGVLGVPAAMVPDRFRRIVSMHTVTGPDRLGVLRTTGGTWRTNPGDRCRGRHIVLLHRRVLRGNISGRHHVHRARPMGCRPSSRPAVLDHD